MNESGVMCISHKEDADGIGSASLIKQAFGGETRLVDYTNMIDALEEIQKKNSLSELYICDLGLNKTTQDKFVKILESLRKNSVSITYIDHHDIDENIKMKIKSLGVNLVHQIEECTTVIIYHTFKTKLQEHSAFVAACSAITDHMEKTSMGSLLIDRFDWLFTLLESSILSYIITSNQKDDKYLIYLVEELSKSKYPHEVYKSFEFVNDQARKISDAIQKITKNLKIMKNLAYVDVTGLDVIMVNFLIGLSGKEVGITYKLKSEHDTYVVSIRGSRSCKLHLGRAVNEISTELGGSGGGHEKVCGGIIPREKLSEFLERFDHKLI